MPIDSETRQQTARAVRVVRATRADKLAEDLAREVLRSTDILDECFVVVEGRGMGSWIRQEMVRTVGAWGGVESPLLRDFMLSLAARAAIAEAPAHGRGGPRELAYRIAGFVLRAESGPTAMRTRIAPFLDMCTTEHGALSVESLLVRSRTLAECFDRYEMDRPDLIEAWEARDEPWKARDGELPESARKVEQWQRAVWREVVPGHWDGHAQWRDLRRLVQRLESGDFPGTLENIGFVSLFGVSAVPPLAMRLLAALGRFRSITVHMLVPTLELQERGVSQREVARLAAREGTSSDELRARDYRHEPNPLVANLGRLAVEAAQVVESFENAEIVDVSGGIDEMGASERAPTLLGSVQRAMEQHEPCSGDFTHSKADGSFTIHGVTTLTRCAEVAHDQVLRAFVEIPGLRQEDVVILTPDVGAHAPTMRAVFRKRTPRVILRVADSSAGDHDSVAAVLLMAMQLAMEDQPFAAVRSIIEHPAVLRALEVDAGDASRVLDALDGAGARRFLDAENRVRWLGVSGSDDAIHTIAWAIDRLTLGIAVGESPARETAIGLVLAASPSTSHKRESLLAIARVIDALGEFVRCTQGPEEPFAGWVDAVGRLADQILPSIDNDQFGNARAAVEQRLAAIAEDAAAACLPPVAWVVAQTEFSRELGLLIEGGAYASGGVMLARMAPCRSVPFRVMIVVGIEHGVFPRNGMREALDLAAYTPRQCDRNQRSEDQLLVLETIHAARDRLAFIVNDRDACTGEPIAQSAIVAEIIAAASREMGCSVKDALSAIVHSHAILSDSPEAWIDNHLVGFDSAAQARAAAIVDGSRRMPRVFASGDTGSSTPASDLDVPVSRLATILKNPAREYLSGCGIVATKSEGLLAPTCEVIDPEALDSWKVRAQALDAVVRREPAVAVRERVVREGMLPHGLGGVSEWDSELVVAEAVLAAIEQKTRENGETPALTLLRRKKRPDLDLEPWLHFLEHSASPAEGRALVVVYDTSSAAKASWMDPIDPTQAQTVLAELRALAATARTTLLPFHGKLLKPWRVKSTDPVDARLARVRKVFDDDVESDANIQLAFRGADFFSFGLGTSSSETPRALVHFLEWIDSRMAATRWGESP